MKMKTMKKKMKMKTKNMMMKKKRKKEKSKECLEVNNRMKMQGGKQKEINSKKSLRSKSFRVSIMLFSNKYQC